MNIDFIDVLYAIGAIGLGCTIATFVVEYVCGDSYPDKKRKEFVDDDECDWL